MLLRDKDHGLNGLYYFLLSPQQGLIMIVSCEQQEDLAMIPIVVRRNFNPVMLEDEGAQHLFTFILGLLRHPIFPFGKGLDLLSNVLQI